MADTVKDNGDMFNYEESLKLLEDRILERWGQMEFNSSVDIHSLLDARTHYTVLYGFLGEKEATLYREYQIAEKTRKREYLVAKMKHMESGMTIGKSETQAELDVDTLINKEVECESDYKLIRYRRESVKETLSTLGQLIGVVRSEREQSNNQHLT